MVHSQITALLGWGGGDQGNNSGWSSVRLIDQVTRNSMIMSWFIQTTTNTADAMKLIGINLCIRLSIIDNITRLRFTPFDDIMKAGNIHNNHSQNNRTNIYTCNRKGKIDLGNVIDLKKTTTIHQIYIAIYVA